MAVLPSHKNSLTYLEHCRIVMADERLTFVKAESAVEKHFSLPYANSNILLLGPGTSITHQAARLLGEEGVCLAFCGGGGTPLYMTSVNEYQPTEYMQGWCRWWYEPQERLAAAKYMQRLRIGLVRKHWAKSGLLAAVEGACSDYAKAIEAAPSNAELLLAEARFSKTLYASLARHYLIEFTRAPRAADALNGFLDAGNYMAYGFAACALWVLGISFAFGINHGTTRRGALVFDVADLVKDAVVMPAAFAGHAEGDNSSQNRHRMLQALEDVKALKTMLETVSQLAQQLAPSQFVSGEVLHTVAINHRSSIE